MATSRRPACVNLAPRHGVDFDGTGEILRVAATPQPGKRTLTFDPDTGLIADEHYDQLPTAYVIDRYGAHPGWVALTFDDGPDWRWTPKILKILEDKHAPATFFVIGENMQAHPGLVQPRGRATACWSAATPRPTPTSRRSRPAWIDVQLNATQRLFEVVAGSDFRLFRPPYFGDAEPIDRRGGRAAVVAQKLGYYIVGLRVDSSDWGSILSNGRALPPPPAQAIVQNALDGLAREDPETGHSSVVLLHDSGGDRSHTVQALPGLIDQLRAHGYTLVTVTQLMGMTPDQAMPPTTRPWMELTLDRIGFGIFREINLGAEHPVHQRHRAGRAAAALPGGAGPLAPHPRDRSPPGRHRPRDRPDGQRADPLLQRGEGHRRLGWPDPAVELDAAGGDRLRRRLDRRHRRRGANATSPAIRACGCSVSQTPARRWR